MLPVLNLGPLSLPVPQFVLLISFWAGSVLSDRKSKQILNNPGFIDRLLWTSILAGILGARLSYFARNPLAFSGEYLSLFSLNLNLFDPLGGLLIALAVSFFVVSRSKIPLLLVLDSISPFLGIFTAAIHLSRLASGAGFGSLTEVPWAINLWGGYRHPVWEVLSHYQ
jgi:prolipoprotein diacylglyceryltransferase